MTASQSKQDLKKKKPHRTTDNMKHSHLHTSSLLVSEGLGTGKRRRVRSCCRAWCRQCPSLCSAVCCRRKPAQRTRRSRQGLDGLQQVTRDLKSGQRGLSQPVGQTQRDTKLSTRPGVVPSAVLVHHASRRAPRRSFRCMLKTKAVTPQ